MIKVLYLCAAPRGTSRLDFEREAAGITECVRQLHGHEFVVDSEFDVTAENLQRLLRERAPTIVHFAGHGVGAKGEEGARHARPVSKDGAALLLQNEEGESVPVSKETLCKVFETRKDTIQMVVLNACYSGAIAAALAAHVPCVIGTNEAIKDAAAIAFAEELYAALAHGDSLKAAVAAGSTQIELVQQGRADLIGIELSPGVDASRIRFVPEGDIGALRGGIRVDGLLRSQLRSIPAEYNWVAQRAFYECCPDPKKMPAHDDGASMPLRFARVLANEIMPRDEDGSDGVHPLLWFLKLLTLEHDLPLRPQLPPEKRERLASWIEMVGIPALTAGAPARRSVLVRKLDAVTWKRESHRLRICLERAPKADSCEVAIRLDDKPYLHGHDLTLESVERIVGACFGDEDALAHEDRDLQRAARELRRAIAAVSSGQLLVEFFLDHRLLAHAVDQWKHEDDLGEEYCLGQKHCVVVRSLYRARLPRSHQARQRLDLAWSQYKVVCGKPSAVTEFRRGEALDGQVAWYEPPAGQSIALAEDIDRSGVVGLLLRRIENAILPLIRAGVPLAVWARDELDDGARDEIQRLVEAGPLHGLPARVHEARLSGESALAERLTLFWDDPEHPLPDDEEAREPEMRSGAR
jgi:hypothetical protein